MRGEENAVGVEEELMMTRRGTSENVEEVMNGIGGGGCWTRVQWDRERKDGVWSWVRSG